MVNVLDIACWVAVAAGAACLALQLLADRVGRLTTSIQALTAWILPLSIVGAVVASFTGRHLTGIAGGAVGLLFLALVTPLVFPRPMPPPADRATGLTVTHANLLYTNPEIEEAARALAAADSDVLALSELTPELAAAVEASTVGSTHPHRVLRSTDGPGGLGIWSRVPIDVVPPPEGTALTLTVDIAVAARPLRLLLTHPPPPLFHADEWQPEIAAIESADADVLARTLLVADLNVSYFNPPFRRFLARSGLRDVHRARRAGFSVSWPVNLTVVPPFVRLDHALVGTELTATAISDVAVPGSDHRGFTVTVTWADR